jgi:hypothetical protein
MTTTNKTKIKAPVRRAVASDFGCDMPVCDTLNLFSNRRDKINAELSKDIPFSEIVKFEDWGNLEAVLKTFYFLRKYDEFSYGWVALSKESISEYAEKEARKSIFAPALGNWMNLVHDVYDMDSTDEIVIQSRRLIFGKAKRAAYIIMASIREKHEAVKQEKCNTPKSPDELLAESKRANAEIRAKAKAARQTIK